MTEQEIYIDRYDWTVHVMYDVHSKDSMNVEGIFVIWGAEAFLSKMPVISCSKVNQTKG